MKDNKGFTLVELLVSLVLISIVLVFIMGLFVQVRGVYNQSKLNSKFENSRTNILKAIYTDINNYGLISSSVVRVSGKEEVALTFNDYRPSQPGKRIVKVLKVETDSGGNKIITYYYRPCTESPSYCTQNITNEERLSNVQEKYDSDTTVGKISWNTSKNKLDELKIPIKDSAGNNYDIDVYIKKTNDTATATPTDISVGTAWGFNYMGVVQTFKAPKDGLIN